MSAYLEAELSQLTFPDSLTAREREFRLDFLRRAPYLLELILEVMDYYIWLHDAPGIALRTKMEAIAALDHYLNGERTAYAILVYMYLDEVADQSEDPLGFHALIAYARSYPRIIRVPRPTRDIVH